jgi:hypothetical protein
MLLSLKFILAEWQFPLQIWKKSRIAEQQVGQDSQERTARIELPGQDCLDKTGKLSYSRTVRP